jgi:hypothetical protein
VPSVNRDTMFFKFIPDTLRHSRTVFDEFILLMASDALHDLLLIVMMCLTSDALASTL